MRWPAALKEAPLSSDQLVRADEYYCRTPTALLPSPVAPCGPLAPAGPVAPCGPAEQYAVWHWTVVWPLF